MNTIINILKIRENQYFILLLALLVFLSKGFHFSSNVIAIISLFYLLDKNLLLKLKRIDFKFYLPFLLYFGIHIIGLLYSDNQQKSWDKLIGKLSFLLIPAIIISEKISKKSMFKILVYFKYWLLIFALFLIVKQVMIDERSLWTLPYFTLKEVTNIHQWYFSQFYFLALLLVLYQTQKNTISIALAILEISFITFFILLLGSGPTMILAVLVIILLVLTVIKKLHLKLLVLGILLMGVFLMKDTFFIKKKIHRITHIEWNLEKNIKKHALVFSSEFNGYNTLELRLIKWHLATDIIKNNLWIGVGAGDHQDLLNKGYEKIQFQNGMKYHYNAHNQYLEEGMKFGIIGIIVLLFFLGNSLILAFKQGNVFLIMMILFIAISALIESVFVRYHGIVFYSIIIPFLYTFHKLKDAKI
ncbi:MAG TPA: O-antigen ligase domain-containing protein [Lutibacter sp.]|nr:O-antigen ligase domain-containing protein [Lutibacter sp.]